jgi:hypothetical protein
MNRLGIWVIAALLFVGLVIVAFLPRGTAQREGRPESLGTGRFVVVSTSPGEIIIMDSSTGDLFSAKPPDVRPYSTRGRPGGRPEMDRDGIFSRDKDRKVDGPPRDLRKDDKDFPRFKDKEDSQPRDKGDIKDKEKGDERGSKEREEDRSKDKKLPDKDDSGGDSEILSRFPKSVDGR